MADNASNVSRSRNARACEACRTSKSRCFFRNQQNVCQKCESNGSQCIVRTKARPMRTKVARPGQNSGSNNESEFSLNLPTVTAPDSGADVEELYEHHKTFFANSDDEKPRDGWSDSKARMPLILQRNIDRKEAERLLLAFRNKAQFFPFVEIPLEATVSSLARHSPFLLLAILTVASSPDPKLHHQIDHEFRRILSSKVIIEGQKSLDYLQGMLVYIAWYPMHVKPKNNQAFIYTNIAISIADDLGLGQQHPNMNVFSAFNTKGLIERSLFTQAARKAYLGCYYLSSALSMGFQKPNNLHYKNLMDHRGEIVLQEESSGIFSASDIYALVRLQNLTERIGEAHSKPPETSERSDDPLWDEMNIQKFLGELNEWRRLAPNSIRNLPFVAIAEHFAEITIYSHTLNLLRRPYYAHQKLNYSSTSNPTANTAHLFSCLTASKTFFETLMSVPSPSYTSFTAVQWAAIVQAILVLSRLTFLMASTFLWNPETTRGNVPLVMYLDALCFRFRDISSTTSDADGQESRKQNLDLFAIFVLILSSVRKSYERRVDALPRHPNPNIAPITPSPIVVGPTRSHCPMHDPNLSVYFDEGLGDARYYGSWDYSNNTQVILDVGKAPVYFDLWATMTGSWAEDS